MLHSLPGKVFLTKKDHRMTIWNDEVKRKKAHKTTNVEKRRCTSERSERQTSERRRGAPYRRNHRGLEAKEGRKEREKGHRSERRGGWSAWIILRKSSGNEEHRSSSAGSSDLSGNLVSFKVPANVSGSLIVMMSIIWSILFKKIYN